MVAEETQLNKLEFQRQLGALIKKLRADKGVSQSELAKWCGKDRQYVFKVENGELNPTSFTLYQIFVVLEVDIVFPSAVTKP